MAQELESKDKGREKQIMKIQLWETEISLK